MKRAWYILGAIAVVVLLILLLSGSGGKTASIRAVRERRPAVVGAGSFEADQAQSDGIYITQLTEFFGGVQAELERMAAEQKAEAERQATAQRTTPTSNYHPGTTTGECTGFAIPDYIIQRESGGNSSAYNPSGAYGCAQTLLSHYSRGQCQGLDPYTIEGQRECVWRLSNGGTNLAPWAATR